MHLKEIELSGFKSFRGHVCLNMSDGITGIVGPNGCGKSNIIDAVKWAMGDMSPTSLRSEKLSDVIFAGSEKHRPAGLAEVTLTFDCQGETSSDIQSDELQFLEVEEEWREVIPGEFKKLPEVSITRKLHRSGESEYLMNGVECRLRDIRDFLAGTGLGKQGYSVVEQGEIAFVVNASPSERRLIIEEASGITRYKSKRKRAQRRLERTKENLDRVEDVYREVVRRLERLERQAERAAKYKRLNRTLRKYRIKQALLQREQFRLEASEIREQLEAARQEREKRQETLEETKQRLSDAKVELLKAEEHHSNVTEDYYELDTKVSLAKSEKQHAKKTLKDLETRRKEAKQTKHSQKDRLEDLRAERQRLGEKLENTSMPHEEALAEVEEMEQKLADKKESRQQLRAERENFRDEIQTKERKKNRAEDRLEWNQERRKELKKKIEEIEQRLEELVSESDGLEEKIDGYEGEIENAQSELDKLTERRNDIEEALQQSRQHYDSLEEQYRTAKNKRMDASTRLESLENVYERGDAYKQGVQEVLNWADTENIKGVFRPLGDYLQVGEKRQRAVATALAPWLDDILVDTPTLARRASEILDNREAGRAGFIVIPEEFSGPESFTEKLLDRVEVLESDDLAGASDAELLFDFESGEIEVTSRGDIVSYGTRLTGGQPDPSGDAVLERNREIKKLKQKLETLQSRESELQEAMQEAGEQVNSLESDFEETDDSVESAERNVEKLKQKVQQLQRKRQRVETDIAQLKEERNSATKTIEKLSEESDEKRAAIEEIDSKIPTLQEQVKARRADIEELDEAISQEQNVLTEKKVELAERRERQRNLKNRKSTVADQIEEAQGKIEKMEQQIESADKRIEETKEQLMEAEKSLEDLTGKHDKQRKRVEKAEAKKEEYSENVQQLEVEVVEARRDLEEQSEAVRELEMEGREKGLEIEHLEERIDSDFGLSILDAMREVTDLEADAEFCEDKIAELDAELQSMGTVNEMAVEEYEEASDRKEFLDDQKQDLQDSVDDLRQAIDEMDRESRRRFSSTFEAVNEKFQEIFPRLFRGGEAELVLTEPDDLLETGVDIEVRPPGKRAQNVSLLSGGEKALTAVSLIFSIFILKPSPFALLDEVDAPLDEANVERFAQLVEQLSETSQMIMVTHDRQTMERCDRLFGVTMEEAGVSKVVTVDLDEIDEQLAS
jgi:chromosome segregation protein